MAAQDAKHIFYEGNIDPDSERGKRWMSATVADYMSMCIPLVSMLDVASIVPVEQMDAHHRQLTRQIVGQITDESSNLLEQTALIAMVATSMLATFLAQLDYAQSQISISGAEEGGSNV